MVLACFLIDNFFAPPKDARCPYLAISPSDSKMNQKFVLVKFLLPSPFKRPFYLKRGHSLHKPLKPIMKMMMKMLLFMNLSKVI